MSSPIISITNTIMPSVTITLTDTPAGGVAIHSDFCPAIGQGISPCQQHALDIIARTHRTWGVASAQGGIVLGPSAAADTAQQHHPV